jgi:hypothetical protein
LHASGLSPPAPRAPTPPARASAAPPILCAEAHAPPAPDTTPQATPRGSGAARDVAMCATLHRRSSLPELPTLGTRGKGREAGSPSAGDARPASVRAGRGRSPSERPCGPDERPGARAGLCVPDGHRRFPARAPSTGPRHGARRPRLPPRPERSEPRAARIREPRRAPRSARTQAPPRKPDVTGQTQDTTTSCTCLTSP